ncbi:DNA polymerase III subunit delta [Thalassotalea sp. PP2-459]|uniref:DNA polymerase III subunit delta n=1 Tax=Thalassotalea sp. PP2-459 TaxID=1742724 RepID=UPI0009443D0B|nr:DNA polymerase III subunit delta [Thalassotalea sp. PP2-459]OKY24601.1 DNA polymerase III subunit delta [Thalassotalea sp. PP2-459]
MRIYHNQLTATLNKPAAPVWLIFGDEPWQKSNSISTIKQHYKQQGFDEIIQFTVDDKFDWSQLVQEYQAMSLFASLRIIELELLTNKIGDTGSKILTDIAQQLVPDVLLLIHGNKLDAPTQKRKWVKALESNGCFLPLYDIEGKHLQQWVQKQARLYQVNMLPDVMLLLAELFEGNLHALDQELQKLAILFGQQLITTEQAEQLLIKQAKFNPFQLIDAMLIGDVSKCINILDQLQHDGTSAGQLLWFIHKEIKQLNHMQEQIASGQDIQTIFKEYRIWDKRKPLYQKALNTMTSQHLAIALARVAEVDLTMKTTSDFNVFILLADVITTLYYGETTKGLSLNYEYGDA